MAKLTRSTPTTDSFFEVGLSDKEGAEELQVLLATGEEAACVVSLASECFKELLRASLCHLTSGCLKLSVAKQYCSMCSIPLWTIACYTPNASVCR